MTTYEHAGMAVATDGTGAYYVTPTADGDLSSPPPTDSEAAGLELGAAGWYVATTVMLENEGGTFMVHTLTRATTE